MYFSIARLREGGLDPPEELLIRERQPMMFEVASRFIILGWGETTVMTESMAQESRQRKLAALRDNEPVFQRTEGYILAMIEEQESTSVRVLQDTQTHQLSPSTSLWFLRVYTTEREAVSEARGYKMIQAGRPPSEVET